MYVDYIRDIIQILSLDDRKEFKQFINRQRSKKSRIDYDLFEILCENDSYPAKLIAERLYGEGYQMNAYHSVRKRLFKHLTDYLVTKRIEDDTTAASSVMGQLTVSRYLFENNNHRTAWHYLLKCEEMATNYELYDLLDNIINVQITYASSPYAPSFDSILEKWKTIRVLSEEDERVNIANTIIQMKLDDYRKNTTPIDLNAEVASVMKEYELQNIAIERPKIAHKIITMARSAILAKKEYYRFEPFVIDQYHRILMNSGFQKKDHLYKLDILYMIAHVLYRTRKFKESSKYLVEFLNAIKEYKGVYSNRFMPKYLLLNASVLSYMGKNDEAIHLLQNEIEHPTVKFKKESELDLYLNLAVYYFQQENFKSAIRTLHRIELSDAKCRKVMGYEWGIRKDLIEVLTQYEMGNVEIAFNRIKSMEKTYSDLLNTSIYARIKTFLGFIKDCINRPEWVSTDDYFNYVNQTLERWPLEKEDIQAMAFYCWLKAKMLRKPYYFVLINTMNGTL